MVSTNSKSIVLEQGNDNLFEDIGFSPEESACLRIRADLMLALRQHIEAQSWTMDEASQTLQQSSDRLASLMNGDIDEFTLEQLIALLLKIGLQIKLEILSVTD